MVSENTEQRVWRKAFSTFDISCAHTLTLSRGSSYAKRVPSLCDMENSSTTCSIALMPAPSNRVPRTAHSIQRQWMCVCMCVTEGGSERESHLDALRRYHFASVQLESIPPTLALRSALSLSLFERSTYARNQSEAPLCNWAAHQRREQILQECEMLCVAWYRQRANRIEMCVLLFGCAFGTPFWPYRMLCADRRISLTKTVIECAACSRIRYSTLSASSVYDKITKQITILYTHTRCVTERHRVKAKRLLNGKSYCIRHWAFDEPLSVRSSAFEVWLAQFCWI